MRQFIFIAAVLWGIAAAAQITVTPGLVSVQSKTDLFCAARPVNGQVQVYCFGTVTTPWDKLIYNSIFPVDATSGSVLVPDIVRLPPGCIISILNPANPPCPVKAQIGWIFWWDGTAINWQTGLNGVGNVSSGHF